MISYDCRRQSILHRMSQFDGEMIQFCDQSAMKHKPGHAAFFVIPTNRVAPTYPASRFYGLNKGAAILLAWIPWISPIIQ